MPLNKGRLWLGGLAGGVVWNIWSIVVYLLVIKPERYVIEQNAGYFLKNPRYPAFQVQWIVMLFVLAIIMAHLYAWSRAGAGPGPATALKIGFLVGFAIGFPSNFAQATWSPIHRILPLGWMLEMWIGAILATLTAGYLYKE
ncbi:MAG: hypothetical protein DMG68_01345 [Acidobacteria bacterium]|jgi:hypothetical protein|nr:MAG: hypothetical protein DMG68_01345 [Acidobacteriota bacterium]